MEQQNKNMVVPYIISHFNFSGLDDDDNQLQLPDIYFQNLENIPITQLKKQPKIRKHFNPQNEWNNEDQNQLIELHKNYGNKWTLLARYYPGKGQNSIKNRFYSRLRKSIRKINKSIGVLNLSKYNKFKLNIIFQLSNISEGKMAQKQKIAPQIFQFYRDFLYKLIEFSEQVQNETLGKPLQPTVEQVENLILPLLALENLFRLARGERLAKGKKKNIAYLRQFDFKLSLQNSAKIVISKQHIFLEYADQIDKETIPSNSPHNNPLSKWSITKNYQQEDSMFGNLRSENMLNLLITSIKDVQQTEKIPEETMNFIKQGDSVENKFQQYVWKDYLGFEMKEYDEGGNGEFMLEQGNGCSFGSFRGSINFNNENNY